MHAAFGKPRAGLELWLGPFLFRFSGVQIGKNFLYSVVIRMFDGLLFWCNGREVYRLADW
jgi:hypothetical protein